MAPPQDLNWDDLRYFLHALQAGSLAGAARRLGVEHSTVGRRLSALERALGAPLMLRSPDGLKLTPLGEKLAPLAEEMARTTGAVRDLAASGKPWVRLAVPSGFTRLFAAALREPQAVSLDIVSGSRPVDLDKGEADLAIRSGAFDDDLIASKLCDIGFALYASPAYLARRGSPQDPTDLTGHEIVGYDLSLAAAPAPKWLDEHTTGAVVVLRSREMTEVMSAASSGAGLALLPCVLANENPSLVRVAPQVLVRQRFSLVYRREARMSEPVRAAIRFVRDVVHRHADAISGIQPDTPR